MKLKIFSLLLIVLVMALTPMIYTGRFDPMSFFSVVANDGMASLKKLKLSAPDDLTEMVSDEKVQVYKWRDEHGVMHFSNTPPVDASKVERLEVNPNSNIVSAVKVPVKKSPVEKKPVAAESTPSPYSVKGMKKVMDDARGIEDLLQKRNEDQLQMMQQR